MRQVVKIKNSLTPAQRAEMSEKLEALMRKYGKNSLDNDYMSGVVDGLNHAHKLINQINDDYNNKD